MIGTVAQLQHEIGIAIAEDGTSADAEACFWLGLMLGGLPDPATAADAIDAVTGNTASDMVPQLQLSESFRNSLAGIRSRIAVAA